MDLAVRALKEGRCRQAVVAAANLILTAKGLEQRANARMLAADGVCRPFDANASGSVLRVRKRWTLDFSYGRAEACVALILETVDDPTKSPFRFDAVIEATSVNHDGRSSALTAPCPDAQQALIVECLRPLGERIWSGDNRRIFWECHGTGTLLVRDFL